MKRRTKKRLIGGLIGVTAAVAAVAVAVFAMPSDGLLEEIAALMTKSTAAAGEAITERSSEPTLVSENAAYRLEIVTDTAAVVLTDKHSGRQWRTNPESLDSETVAMGDQRERLLAQLTLSYYQSSGMEKTLDSYHDAVAKGQYAIYLLDNGVRVDYEIGDKSKGAESLPKQMDQARYEELFVNTDKLSETDKTFMQKRYLPDEETGLYVMRATASDIIINQMVGIFDKLGYTYEDLEADSERFGFSLEGAERILFTVPLVYTLTDKGMRVTVSAGEITGPEDFPVASISLLEFFGAAQDDTEGYMVLPDGSGALLRYGSPAQIGSDSYSKFVYGADAAAYTMTQDPGQPVTLPVFGAVQGTDGYIAAIHAGDAIAKINAYKAGNNNSYNCVYPSFELRPMTYTVMGEELGEQQNSYVPLFPVTVYEGNLTVEYRLCSGEGTDYIHLAGMVREYLADYGQLPAAPAAKTPVVVETVGGVSGYKTLLGVYRTTGIVPLTTYAQDIAILEELRAAGLTDVALRLSGWASGGMDQQYAGGLSPLGELGGRAGFRELADYCAQQGVVLYPDTALLTSSAGNGYTVLRDSAESLHQEASRLFDTDLYSGRPDREITALHQGYRYILSPNRLWDTVQKFQKRLQPLPATGLSLQDLGSDVYADYKKQAGIHRPAAKEVSRIALERLAEGGTPLMLDGGRTFSYPYADIAVNIPLGHSGYYLFDEEIPFFQAVYHGLLPYTGAALNESSDVRTDFLRSVEYGSGLLFRFLVQNADALKETDYSYMFSNDFSRWKDTAADMAERADEVFSRTAGSQIVAHGEVADGVYRTGYANGVEVYVNYGPQDVVVGEQVVPAGDFIVREG